MMKTHHPKRKKVRKLQSYSVMWSESRYAGSSGPTRTTMHAASMRQPKRTVGHVDQHIMEEVDKAR